MKTEQCLLTIRYGTRQKEVRPFIIKGKSIGGPGLDKTDKIRSLFWEFSAVKKPVSNLIQKPASR